jgi:hypothetical protein
MIYTDGLKSFSGLLEAGFKHVIRNQPLRSELRKGAKSAVPLADRAIGNLQQWLIGTYRGVSLRPNSRFTSTNSSFDATVVIRPLPHFRHSLVWERAADQPSTSRFGEQGISIPTYWGLMKQPDN